MMQQYNANSYLFGGNAPYVEELYEAYLNNPGSVPDNWRAYFDNMQHVPAVDGSNRPDVVHSSVIASFAERAKQGPIRTVTAAAGEVDPEMARHPAGRRLPQSRLALGQPGPAAAPGASTDP